VVNKFIFLIVISSRIRYIDILSENNITQYNNTNYITDITNITGSKEG